MICERVGLQARPEDVQALLNSRPRSLAGLSPARYADHLLENRDDGEWQRICEQLAIPETHFFRNRPQWQAFRSHVLPRAAARAAQETRPIRLWSAGCSTGEEAYTASAVLAEFGGSIPPATIVATDLVEARLDAARKASYRQNSLRGVHDEEVARLFDRRGDLYVLDPGLRDRPRFERLNLADFHAVDAFVHAEGPFDVVFCRNVLIYFAPELIRKLLDRFASALAASGTLILGHADFASQWTDSLVPERLGEAFVWRPRQRASSQAPEPPQPAPSPAPCCTRARRRRAPSTVAEPRRRADAPAVEAEAVCAEWPAVQELLQLVRAGPGERAVEAARAYAARAEVVPDAHFALGAALEMAGEIEAARHAYRRAVFLDRGFALAHWRLAMLLAQAGQLDRADLEARAAVRTLAKESLERLQALSDLEPRELEKTLEDSLAWITSMRAERSGSSSS